jgi:hypothetical protein
MILDNPGLRIRIHLMRIRIHLIRIRIRFQHFRLNTDPRIQGFDDQKLEKKLQLENFFCYVLNQKLQFTYP